MKENKEKQKQRKLKEFTENTETLVIKPHENSSVIDWNYCLTNFIKYILKQKRKKWGRGKDQRNQSIRGDVQQRLEHFNRKRVSGNR